MTGLLLCVPMTTKAKGFRFEVGIGSGDGIALADQVKSFDWRARNARRKGRATAEELQAVRARVRALVG
jgi:mRNA interferase MazF